MASIQNIESLLSKLTKRMAAAVRDSNVDVAVGFSARSAIFVHENMNPVTLGLHKERTSGIGWYWGPADYGPKFLEAPARELAPELGKMIRQGLQAKLTMAQSLMMAGLRLQREAQQRVPREHSTLYQSAYTKLEAR